MKFSDYTTLDELARKHHINYHTIRYRLRRKGVPMTKKNGVVFIARKHATKKAVSK